MTNEQKIHNYSSTSRPTLLGRLFYRLVDINESYIKEYLELFHEVLKIKINV